MYATPASFFTISGRGYSNAFGTVFQPSVLALKKLAAPPPQFDALFCSRSVNIRHEFTPFGIAHPNVFASMVSQLPTSPVRTGRFCSLIATSESSSKNSRSQAAISQFRRASCHGTSPKRGAPFYSSAPTYQPFHWRFHQSCLWLDSFNLAVQVGLWARFRIAGETLCLGLVSVATLRSFLTTYR